MSEIWAAAIAAAGAIGGGVLASQGAKDAAKTSAAGSAAGIAEQRRQYDTTRSDTANARVIGDQALNALGSIYGYKPAAKPQSFNEWSAANPMPANLPGVAGSHGNGTKGAIGGSLLAGAVGMDPITGALLGGIGGNNGARSVLDPLGLFGGKKEKPKPTADEVARAAYDQYLQNFDYAGGQPGGNAFSGPSSGPKMDPRNGIDPTTGYRLDGSGGVSPGIGLTAAAPAGPDYSNFFASPDYTFRRDEGTRGIERSASARGLTGSGNALAALSEYNSNLAAGEFGNYFNRQAALAGIGQAGVNTATQAGMNSANNIGGYLQSAADARASGIAGQADAWGNALGTLGGIAYDRWGRPKKGN